MAKLETTKERVGALKEVNEIIKRLFGYDEWITKTQRLPEDNYVYKLNIAKDRNLKEGGLSITMTRDKLIAVVKTSGQEFAKKAVNLSKQYEISLDDNESELLNKFILKG